MDVSDLGFSRERKIVFRFSQAMQFHIDLTKKLKKKAELIPDFPQKNSLGFWNRTNNDHKKIDNRLRELEYYFIKIFNDPFIRSQGLVKNLLNSDSNIDKTFRYSVQHRKQ